MIASVLRGGDLASEVDASWLLRLTRPDDELTITIGETPVGPPDPTSLYDVQTACLPRSRSDELFGRVVTGRYRQDRIGDAVGISHAILPLVSAQPGFVGVFLFTQPSGANFSVSIWESEAHSSFQIQSGWWQAQVDRFQEIYVAPPTRREYRLWIRVPSPPPVD